MSEEKLYLASDNWAPAHPQVIKAIEDANIGYAPAYGNDTWTKEASDLIKSAFNAPCDVFMVPTGTGSNVLALKLCARSYESIICSDVAHIHFQETGATESITGSKLLTLEHKNGKVTPEALLRRLKSERAFGRHSTSPRVLSIAQATEFGTVYDLDELKNLKQICKDENLLLHIDGSRFYNAAASLKLELDEIAHASGVDILSLGGTKNGLLCAEALIIFNKNLLEGSDYMHKQTLQLFSKMRFISAQFIPFIKNKLWLDLALHANKKAQEIAEIIAQNKLIKINYEVQTNQIFFSAPPSCLSLIQEKTSCFLWDIEKQELRIIASWCTSDDDIKAIKRLFDELKNC